MFGHSYKHTLETQKRSGSEKPENGKELLEIVADDTSALAPLISRSHSSSVCLGLPIMHHWVHKASCCACEPPDGAPGSNWHPTERRGSPPLRRKTTPDNVISAGPAGIPRDPDLTLYFLIQLCRMSTISSSSTRSTASQDRHL